MPIIIEGPDGAGQSGLEYLQKLACDGVIIDRCWVSETLTEFCGRAGIPIIVLEDNDPATAMEEILKCML